MYSASYLDLKKEWGKSIVHEIKVTCEKLELHNFSNQGGSTVQDER